MGNCVIDKSLVAAPERCRLILDVDESRLGVTVVDPLAPTTPLYREIPLPQAPVEQRIADSAELLVRALEEAVYDNPVLLAGFDRVDVLLRTRRHVLLPATESELDPESVERLAAATAGCADDTVEWIALPRLSAASPQMVLGADLRLAAFLRRTFDNPHFRHPLDVIAAYGASMSRIRVAGHMLVHVSRTTVDVIVYGEDGVAFANTFAYVAPTDALYFIMAVRNSLELTASDELYIAGEAGAREAVTRLLRRFVHFAMPLPSPSAATRDLGMPFSAELLANLAINEINAINN